MYALKQRKNTWVKIQGFGVQGSERINESADGAGSIFLNPEP
jgi:hypothetical protein